MYKSANLTRCRCIPIPPSEETVVEIPVDLTPYLVVIKNELFLVLRDSMTDEYLTYTIVAGDTYLSPALKHKTKIRQLIQESIYD